jgi:hypothetical protein
MYWNAAPARIWSYNPQMKWILVLRNPVERAFSAWNMERQRQADYLSFADAVAQESERCREALPFQHRVFSYLDRGFYAHQVRRLFNIFGRDQCLLLLNEELRTDHAGTMQRVFEFLEVDSACETSAENVFQHEYEESLDPNLSAQLSGLFYYDIKELEQLSGKTLSTWYKGAKRPK